MLIIKYQATLPEKSVPWLEGEYKEIQVWIMEGTGPNGVEFNNLVLSISIDSELDPAHLERTGEESSTAMWCVDGDFCEFHKRWEYETPRYIPEEDWLLDAVPGTDHTKAFELSFATAIQQGQVVVQGPINA